MSDRGLESKVAWPSRNLQKWVTMLTHFLCLSIIFILPEVLMSKSGAGGGDGKMYIKALVYVAVFYVNYYIIIDRCIGKRFWVPRLICWNLLVLLVVMVIALWLMPPERGDMFRPRRPDLPEISVRMRRASFLMRDVVMVILTVGLSLAVKLSDYWVKLRQKNHSMEIAQRQEELDSLKHQLNPHFLFNTLNSIYALIAISPDKAQRAVHELSRLLRFVLYENSPTVPLENELSFVDNYVKLMKLRIGDKFPVTVRLDPGRSGSYEIAPLLFISPVENAFKYGNTGRPDAFIDISIVCEDGTVDCRIANRFIADADTSKESSGIGQNNLRRRVDLIYGQRADIHTVVEDDIYIFTLKIKLTPK